MKKFIVTFAIALSMLLGGATAIDARDRGDHHRSWSHRDSHGHRGSAYRSYRYYAPGYNNYYYTPRYYTPYRYYRYDRPRYYYSPYRSYGGYYYGPSWGIGIYGR